MSNLHGLAESKSYLTVLLRNVNIKCRIFHINDKIATEGAKIAFATSKYELHQVINIINESTHVLENLLLCVDLVFTSELNFLDNSDEHRSLHLNLNYHHQISNKKYMIANKETLNLLEK